VGQELSDKRFIWKSAREYKCIENLVTQPYLMKEITAEREQIWAQIILDTFLLGYFLNLQKWMNRFLRWGFDP
jgi:hypothetical protein